MKSWWHLPPKYPHTERHCRTSFHRRSEISSWLVDTCVSPNVDRRSLPNLNVSRGDAGSHIYMQRVRPLNTSLSHMPFERYCSLCLFGNHLSRDVTFSADNDPDLCLPCAPLKINTVTTAADHRIPCLRDAGHVSVATRYIVGLGWTLGRIHIWVHFCTCAQADWSVIKVFVCFTWTSRYIWDHLTPGRLANHPANRVSREYADRFIFFFSANHNYIQKSEQEVLLFFFLKKQQHTFRNYGN